MKDLLAISAAIVLNASANILIKVGMRIWGGRPDLSSPLGLLWKAVTNPALMAGVACFGLALAAYSYVLSSMNLSVAYPIMTSVGYCIVVLFSWLFLAETISGLQLAGFAFIIAGVWMVAWQGHP